MVAGQPSDSTPSRREDDAYQDASLVILYVCCGNATNTVLESWTEWGRARDMDSGATPGTAKPSRQRQIRHNRTRGAQRFPPPAIGT
jgi:hypothetical protein